MAVVPYARGIRAGELWVGEGMRAGFQARVPKLASCASLHIPSHRYASLRLTEIEQAHARQHHGAVDDEHDRAKGGGSGTGRNHLPSAGGCTHSTKEDAAKQQGGRLE